MTNFTTRDLHVDRRTFGRGLAATALTAPLLVPVPAAAQAGNGFPRIHRFDHQQPFPVNAYVIEGERSLVVVDATLTVSSSQALRQRIDELTKPLAAVLLTHPHPDHYAGLGNIASDGVPIVSVAGVAEIARRDDAAKDALIGRMFGDEWPKNRVFPNEIVKEGDTLDFGDGIAFDVLDIGPAESFHDSVFVLRSAGRPAFTGDLVFSFMHAYMADGQNAAWRKALARIQSDLPEATQLYVGHGAPVTPALATWQHTYLDKFEAAIAAADWSDKEKAQASVVAAMRDYLPNDDLVFLMQLSIEPTAKILGVLR